MRMKDENGYILVAVMVIGLLVSIIGFAASKMSDLGNVAYGSQKKYEIAAAAAEYAVNQAINEISLKGNCPSSTTSHINDTNRADYLYLGAQAGGYCFIRGQGMFRGADVVKTVVVPNISDFDYGALTMRFGGKTATGGSSAIMNCDEECRSPTIVYGGTLEFTANLDKSSCKKASMPSAAKGYRAAPASSARGITMQRIDTDRSSSENLQCIGLERAGRQAQWGVQRQYGRRFSALPIRHAAPGGHSVPVHRRNRSGSARIDKHMQRQHVEHSVELQIRAGDCGNGQQPAVRDHHRLFRIINGDRHRYRKREHKQCNHNRPEWGLAGIGDNY